MTHAPIQLYHTSKASLWNRLLYRCVTNPRNNNSILATMTDKKNTHNKCMSCSEMYIHIILYVILYDSQLFRLQCPLKYKLCSVTIHMDIPLQGVLYTDLLLFFLSSNTGSSKYSYHVSHNSSPDYSTID